MAFFRVKTSKDGKRRYLYRETRWREGGRVRSKSVCIGRYGVGRPKATFGEAATMFASNLIASPLLIAPALPFMIAWDLASGNRVEELKAQLARDQKPSTPAQSWAREKFEGQRTAFYASFTVKNARSPFEHREAMYKVSHPTPAYRAKEEYRELRELNQRQYANYQAKVAETYQAKEQARADWEAEQAAAKQEGGSEPSKEAK